MTHLKPFVLVVLLASGVSLPTPDDYYTTDGALSGDTSATPDHGTNDTDYYTANPVASQTEESGFKTEESGYQTDESGYQTDESGYQYQMVTTSADGNQTIVEDQTVEGVGNDTVVTMNTDNQTDVVTMNTANQTDVVTMATNQTESLANTTTTTVIDPLNSTAMESTTPQEKVLAESHKDDENATDEFLLEGGTDESLEDNSFQDLTPDNSTDQTTSGNTTEQTDTSGDVYNTTIITDGSDVWEYNSGDTSWGEEDGSPASTEDPLTATSNEGGYDSNGYYYQTGEEDVNQEKQAEEDIEVEGYVVEDFTPSENNEDNVVDQVLKEIEEEEEEEKGGWKDAMVTSQALAVMLAMAGGIFVMYALYVARRKMARDARERQYKNLLQEDLDSDSDEKLFKKKKKRTYP